MNSPFKRPDIDLTGMASMTAAVVAREFLLISRFIPPPSSFWSFGLPWLTAWGSRSTKPQHTTRKPTGCASSFTSHSRPLSGVLLQVCAARLGKTSGILQLNWSLASHSRILGNSCLRAPPFVFQYLYAVSPFHQRLVFHSWCTTACPTLLFCLTARSGLFNQAESLSFLDFGSWQEVVPIDRLKPAHVLHDQVVPAQALFCSCPPTTGLTDFGFSCRSAPHPAQLELSAAFPDHQCQPCPQASLKQKNS